MRRLVMVGLAVSLVGCNQKPPTSQTVGASSAPVASASPPSSQPAASPAAAASPAPTSEVIGDATIEARYSPTYDKCMKTGDAADGVTVAMRDCVGEEFKIQDGNLNAIYKTALASLSPPQQEALRVSERAWLKSTKSKCDHAGDEHEGGTMQPLEIDDCYLSETVRRSIQLEHPAQLLK